MLESVRKPKIPLLVLAMMLHWLGVSFGQIAANPAASQTVQRYEPPSGVGIQGSLEGAVSSEEFQKYISVTPSTPAPRPLESLLPRPSSNRSLPLESERSPVVISLPNPQGSDGDSMSPVTSPPIPADSPPSTQQHVRHVPYWLDAALQPLIAPGASVSCQVELEQLVWLSTKYSPKVQSLLILPQIQRTEIGIAEGEFDPRRFAKTNYGNTSDPVGNTLTTGGPNRLIDDTWQNSVGLRKLHARGGKTELSQALNAKDSNSLFFKPNNQIDTRLSLNFTQPLMRGSGRLYNTSAIRIAGIKTQGAVATANRELQGHALDIINAYWDLSLQRHFMIQATRGRERLLIIKQQLENRSEKDLLPLHLYRVQAAIGQQKGKIGSAAASIKGLEATLKSLVNAPELQSSQCMEIIPSTMPEYDLPSVALDDELCSSLLHRWDIVAIQTDIETAVLEKNLAVNEMKPQLDFFAESYVRGLKGDNNLAGSYVSQFGDGRPSVFFGAEYLSPKGNRTAKANLNGRQLEQAKLLYDYQHALLKAKGEIITAIADSEGTYELTNAAIETAFASVEEVKGYYDKFEDFLG
ncbi:MAG: hypothetical protein ABL921_32775, partial [Pirellula sp.]